MAGKALEKTIVASRTLGEILLGAINDVIRADGSDHFHIPRTAYARNIRPERLGDLHSEGTYSSRRTVDQHLLPRLNVSLVAKTLQCGEAAIGAEAACSNVTSSGFVTNADSEAHAYSAKARGSGSKLRHRNLAGR
jgi:hypothetical protein